MISNTAKRYTGALLVNTEEVVTNVWANFSNRRELVQYSVEFGTGTIKSDYIGDEKNIKLPNIIYLHDRTIHNITISNYTIYGPVPGYLKLVLPKPVDGNYARELIIRLKYEDNADASLIDFDIFENDELTKAEIEADFENNHYKSNSAIICLVETKKYKNGRKIHYAKIRNG